MSKMFKTTLRDIICSSSYSDYNCIRFIESKLVPYGTKIYFHLFMINIFPYAKKISLFSFKSYI